MANTTTPYRGNSNERPRQVTVLVDGLLLWNGQVDASSDEQAAVAAFCMAITKFLIECSASGEPEAPPVAGPPGVEQTSYLT